MNAENKISPWWKVAIKNLKSAIMPGDQQGGTEPWWFTYIPLIAGTLAAISGVLTVKAGYLANDAVYNSNQAVLFQSMASDAWAEYQSNSIKARIIETVQAVTVKKPELEQKCQEYRTEQPKLKEKAMGFEAERDARLRMSDRRIHDRDRLTYAGVAVQLSIALASLAAMTKKERIFQFTVALTMIAVGMTAYGYILMFLR